MTSTSQLEGMVFAGESAFAERLRVQVRRIAPHFKTVTLIGEPGSGKSDVARELHRLSPVADGPFVSCSAEEFAQGGVEDLRFRHTLSEACWGATHYGAGSASGSTSSAGISAGG